jgi:hypothetical protein
MEIVGIGALTVAALVVAGVVLLALYLAGGGGLET